MTRVVKDEQGVVFLLDTDEMDLVASGWVTEWCTKPGSPSGIPYLYKMRDGRFVACFILASLTDSRSLGAIRFVSEEEAKKGYLEMRDQVMNWESAFGESLPQPPAKAPGRVSRARRQCIEDFLSARRAWQSAMRRFALEVLNDGTVSADDREHLIRVLRGAFGEDAVCPREIEAIADGAILAWRKDQ